MPSDDDDERYQRRLKPPPTGVRKIIQRGATFGELGDFEKTPPLGTPAMIEWKNKPALEKLEARARATQKTTDSTLSSVEGLRRETKLDIDRLNEHLLKNTEITTEVRAQMEFVLDEIKAMRKAERKRAQSEAADQADAKKMRRRLWLKVLGIVGVLIGGAVAIIKIKCGVGGE